ncbi:hypothetical protein C0991_005761 [Blastosporella zonata]|nr:hypothetical protein C0991_005761 [Blastosporella zonata]
MGAVSFIETMDHTSLSNITQEEFEQNVEDAIQMLPQTETSSPLIAQAPSTKGPIPSSHEGEESAQPLAISTPAQSISDDAKRLFQKTGDTISKPLNAIGRIFSEALDGAEGKLSYLPGPFAPFELGRENREQGAPVPRWSPYKPRIRRVPSPSSPTGFAPEETPSRLATHTHQLHQPLALSPSQNLLSPTLVSPRVQSLATGDGQSVSRTPTPNLDLAGMSRQIDAAHEQAAAAARDTLIQIFPSVETEVIELVLEAQSGDLGKSIEALLDISGVS